MDSGERGTGNSSDEEDMEMSIRAGCRRENVITERILNSDDAVYLWYLEQLYYGIVVTVSGLREKAIELKNASGRPHNFRAGITWLKRFKTYYRIKQVQRKKCVYPDVLQSVDFFRDDLYTADVLEIEWRPMPKNSNQKSTEKPELVTVMVCANTSWSHALPLLVKNVPFCPLMDESHKMGSMDSEFFREWYEKKFIPDVKTKYGSESKSKKVLLLLYADQFHLNVNTLNAVDENFEVKFLSSNITLMDHILIMKLKRIFKTNILRCLLSDEGDDTQNEEVKEYSQKLPFEKCRCILGDVWNILCKEKREEISKKQRGVSEEQDAAVFKPEIDIEEFWELFKKILGCSQCSKQNALEWLLIDTINPSHAILKENETVTTLKSEELSKDCDTDDVDVDNKSSTNAEIWDEFKGVHEWCAQQKEC